jgi:prevent-host-death family protein
MEVSVRELKSRLSEYLRRVTDGEEVVVTSRGQPVARLMPPRKPRSRITRSGTAEAVELLQSLPWIRPGKTGKQRVGLDKPAKLKPGAKPMSETVAEMRD